MNKTCEWSNSSINKNNISALSNSYMNEMLIIFIILFPIGH